MLNRKKNIYALQETKFAKVKAIENLTNHYIFEKKKSLFT